MKHDLGDLPHLFEDEMLDNVGSVVEVRADADASHLRLVLEVHGFDDFHERRAIECHKAVRWRLSVDTVYSFEVHDEHPALLAVADEHANLYFTGTPSDPARLAVALRTISANIAGRYFDFDTAINSVAGDLPTLLSGGYGKLASGPATLLRSFQEGLEDDGVATSLLATGEPKMYIERETRWAPIPPGLKRARSRRLMGGGSVVRMRSRVSGLTVPLVKSESRLASMVAIDCLPAWLDTSAACSYSERCSILPVSSVAVSPGLCRRARMHSQ